MFQTVSRLLPGIPLAVVTAVATHLVRPICADADALQARPPSNGRQIFPQSYQFSSHLLFERPSRLTDIPWVMRTTTHPFSSYLFLVGGCAYFILPLNLFLAALVIACAMSFYAHVFFHKGISRRGIAALKGLRGLDASRSCTLFITAQANSNSCVIHFFWDKIFRYLSKAGCRLENQAHVITFGPPRHQMRLPALVICAHIATSPLYPRKADISAVYRCRHLFRRRNMSLRLVNSLIQLLDFWRKSAMNACKAICR